MDILNWDPTKQTCSIREQGEYGPASTSDRSQRGSNNGPIVVATHRDAAGRILAPVRINEKGPFYLVANTGANTIALSVGAAQRLNLPLNAERPIIVHGVTGSTTVPMVRVTSITMGGLPIPTVTLPVLGDAFEGVDGMLGLIGLASGKLRVDFNRQTLTLSSAEAPSRAEPSAVSIAMDPAYPTLLVVDTNVQGIPVKTIIDTAAQATIGNLALYRALGVDDHGRCAMDPIIGATLQRQSGVSRPLPPVCIGTLRVLGARISYCQVPIFDRVGLTNAPAMLLGMDVLGRMRQLTCDFTKRYVEFVARSGKLKFHRQRP